MGRCGKCCEENCGGACSDSQDTTYTFFAIADSDDLKTARWYRTHASHASSGWMDDIAYAKIWSRRGPAKSRVTSLRDSARLVEFTVTSVTVVDDSERLKKLEERRRKAEVRLNEHHKKRELEEAKLDVARAQRRLKELEEQR